MTTKAKTEVKQPHVKEYLEPLEAGKGKEWVVPSRSLEAVQHCQHHDFILLL